jgi:hypothetical protein
MKEIEDHRERIRVLLYRILFVLVLGLVLEIEVLQGTTDEYENKDENKDEYEKNQIRSSAYAPASAG